MKYNNTIKTPTTAERAVVGGFYSSNNFIAFMAEKRRGKCFLFHGIFSLFRKLPCIAHYLNRFALARFPVMSLNPKLQRINHRIRAPIDITIWL